MTTPAVVLKSKFVMPSSKEYQDYVSYIDRKDAKRDVEIDLDSKKTNDFFIFHSYMDYMDDDKKYGALFTDDKDVLTEDDRSHVKERFNEAQENGSPLWQDVISFDNDWLIEQNILQPDNKELDEEKMKNVVRGAMDTLLKTENMDKSALWTASIHYNTDNIHVHVATVEPKPTREKMKYFDEVERKWKEQYRAKRKQGSLDKMKSSVVNQIVDRTEDYNRIDGFIRGTVHYKKEEGVHLASDKKTKKLFMKAMSLMPDDLRQWRYGYQSINDARPYIDEMVDIYLGTYHKEDMEELDKLLDKQVDITKRLYGDESRHEKYKDTKMDDLRKRMGNAVLTEMRSYKMRERNVSYEVRRKNSIERSRDNGHNSLRLKNWSAGREIHFAVMRLRYAMKKSYHEHQKDRNIDEYDRMLDGYE